MKGSLATIIASVLFGAILFLACWQLLRPGRERPIAFEVEIPTDPSLDLEDLGPETPSIKCQGSSAIQCHCPATGNFLGAVNPITPDGIDRAIERAAKAQLEWAKSNFVQRRKVLRTIMKYILDHQDDIVRVACIDSGKTRVDAAFGEVLVTVEKLAWTIKHGEKALRAEWRPTNLLICYNTNDVRYEPLGVVAACVSWNYPFHNLFNPIISSLFTGNALILKSSEQTCWSAQYFTSIARHALQACGHSPNLIRHITCWPSTAPHLTSHPGIAHITFIGSQRVAHSIAESASKSLTPCTLELGGKDPAIILDNLAASDLSRVCSILMRGVFQAAGQNCIGIERVIALPKVHARLLELIKPRVAALRVGYDLDDTKSEPVDVGACISSGNFVHLMVLIKEAVAQGAVLHVGGTELKHHRYPRGDYFAPTLLSEVTPDMRIARQEIFAPVFVLMRAESAEAALRIANGTQYALGASVFGRHGSRDVEKVVSGLKCGMVAVNDFASYYMTGLPFGGVKGSGHGRFNGVDGLKSLCAVKSVCTDGWSGVIKTKIPGRLDYGGREEGYGFIRGLVDVLYGWKLVGLKNMLF